MHLAVTQMHARSCASSTCHRGTAEGSEPGSGSKPSSLLPKGSLPVPFKENIKEASQLPGRPPAHSKVCVWALVHLPEPWEGCHCLSSLPHLHHTRLCRVLSHLVTLEWLVDNQADAGDPLGKPQLRTPLDIQGHLGLRCGTWGQGVGELPPLSPTTLAHGPSLKNDAPVEGSRSALAILGGETQAHFSKEQGSMTR